jgi:hypothetical protein
MRSTKARMLAGTTFLAPLTLIAKVNAGEVRVCAIVRQPGELRSPDSGFGRFVLEVP